jgi:probable F420-dependent oxidoreductase
MQLGLALPQFGPLSDATRIADFARTTEELGYRSLWVGDRMLTPVRPSDPYPGVQQPYPAEFTRTLDPIVTLSVAAAATEHIRIGASALDAPLYNPVLLNRALTSIDLLSNGRLDVGAGLGWLRDEYTAANVGWNDRGARLTEILDIWQLMWTQSQFGYAGKFFTVAESVTDLPPVQPGGPPVLLSGLSVPAMKRIGRRGVGWLSIGGLPEAFESALWNTAVGAAEASGRDPARLRRVTRINSPAGSSVADIGREIDTCFQRGATETFVDFSYCTRNIDDALEVAAKLAADVGAQ